MENLNQFIKYIEFDDEKRILVSVQNQFENYLKEDKIKSLLKESCQNVLKEDFVSLEIGKNVARLTVKEGSEDASMTLVKEELVKGLEMAMMFLAMNNQ
ncbi:MAG: hypothetical protein N4A76_17790 [Firmicutes bacterium]|jgi:hypothetical protein|nr:hypothetical protein [Bacillota bacterium]